VRIQKEEFVAGPENDRGEVAFFTEEDSLLRIEMAHRIQKVALEAGFEKDIVVPQKKLVLYKNLNGVTEPNRRYCVVCEKIDVLSAEETAEAIEHMDGNEQRNIATKISTIVQKAGFVDANFNNIRLSKNKKKFVFIDTEPAGLMTAKKPGLWNKFFGPRGASVEKCARIGLCLLKNQTANNSALEAFHNQIECDYQKAIVPEISKWKITLSILSFGIIPVIHIINALAKTILAKRTFEQINTIKKEMTTDIEKYFILKLEKCDLAPKNRSTLK
jgi:hypothetical protein